MQNTVKIYIAGHTGLVGSAIFRNLQSKGYVNIITRTHKELDLANQLEVNHFFEQEKPEYVFCAAAKVGGIQANSAFMADFAMENLKITTNIIDEAFKNGVKKLLYLGSACIYPREAPQPIREESLLAGSLEPTNEGYGIAKSIGVKLCDYYKKQYSVNFISCMPANVYGPGDSFDESKNHVIPALIQRFHRAKSENLPRVVIWGSGKPRREFMYIDDMAEGCVFLMEKYDGIGTVNLGAGEDIAICDLARLIAEIVCFTGDIEFDTSKPDGMPRRIVDSSRINRMGFKANISIREGLEKTYQWYLTHIAESKNA